MATNFTNKYMQVFQDYNEFSEHSADYVRGEDHIAFLIEENEVIYWLYLEQVWRPLNVRTTTTGQLEDGRTKVAVRLEYVEGGQKYTSVPNIPDPERITSMSHFLEDYPDIEEVNVSGTVNLTDLSYAFAGSKIKDFSMLDTSKVKYAYGLLQNVNDEDLIVNFSSALGCNANYIVDGTTLNEFNWIDGYGNTDNVSVEDIKAIASNPCKINKFNIHYRFSNYNNTFNSGMAIRVRTDNNIKELIAPYIQLNVATDGGANPYNVNLNIIKGQYVLFNINNDRPTALKGNDLYIEAEDIEFNFASSITNESGSILLKNYCTPNNSIILDNVSAPPRFSFGGGIKIENGKEIILGDNLISKKTIIGNFVFTTPIVDDTFYAKYNNPISIFQYKTTFEEVADVNISSKVDSSLLYVNWYPITWNTNNMSIEINNIVDLTSMSIYTSCNFKKFILDNRTLVNDNNIPLYYNINITANDGYISGKFKAPTYNWSYGESGTHRMTLYENTLFKDVVLYDYSQISIRNNDVFTTNNIKIDKLNAKLYSRIIANSDDSKEIDLYNLKDNNNIVNCSLYLYENNILKYYEDISLNINDADIYIKGIINYINKENNNNFTGIINFDRYDTFSVEEEYNKLSEEVYINSNEEIQIDNFINKLSKTNAIIRNYVTSIFGNNITIIIPTSPSSDMDLFLKPSIANDAFKHIDITKSKCDSAFIIGYYITIFVNLDNESTINLITKLVDNTANSSKTIYMYRSQANIIGEENIAGAVAKNYEIAIIEN